MKPYVYIDVLVAENFFINFMLIYTIKRYYKIKTNIFNMIVGTFIGALYVVVGFYPKLHILYTLIMKITVSVIMIAVSFNPKSLRKFFNYLIAFYIEAFMLGGTILAIFFLNNNNIKIYNGFIFIKNISAEYIIVGSILLTIFIKFTFDFIEKYYFYKNNCLKIDIFYNNKECNIDGFVDTGNSLRDPITHESVIIVSTDAVKSILPEELKNVLLNKKTPVEVFSTMESSGHNVNLRLIPYNALGTENGMLVGLRVKKINFYFDKKKKCIDNPIIALYNNVFNNERYQALINPDILKSCI